MRITIEWQDDKGKFSWYICERVLDPLGLIHVDVCRPYMIMSRTCDGFVYLMKQKYEAFKVFKSFENMVQKHLGKTLKYTRSNRGGDYKFKIVE